MHVVTVTRGTAATPEAIWRLWAEVPNRTRWDDALERITLEGPFQSAAAGIVKLRGQPERRLRLCSVTGPTSPVLAPVLRRILQRELPPTLDKLVALAERTGAHRPST
jgi:hypothetical protein